MQRLKSFLQNIIIYSRMVLYKHENHKQCITNFIEVFSSIQSLLSTNFMNTIHNMIGNRPAMIPRLIIIP